MEILIGSDIVEVNRIKKAILKNKSFLNRVFSKEEIDYCMNKKTHIYESFAVRFAAKEAYIKAISKMLDSNFSINLNDIKIINDNRGKPILVEKNNFKNSLSLSHTKDFAIANVIVIIE